MIFLSSQLECYNIMPLSLTSFQILDNGCAYRMDGDVYFSVEKFPEYGQLSGRKLEDNRAGERVAIDARKKNPADFALWKASSLSITVLHICNLCITSFKLFKMVRVVAAYVT